MALATLSVMAMTSEHVRIRFELNPDDWHKSSAEGLWAKPLAIAGRQLSFELDNSPFFAKGVSYRDVVSAVEREGAYEFAGVISRSGHSTYRLAIEQEDNAFREWWTRLNDLGCTGERGECQGMKLFAVDVPPTSDIDAVHEILLEGKQLGIWHCEEGHMGHPSNEAAEKDSPRRT